jgi:flagellar motility protein MotE (MotC chaperone)
MSDTRKFGTYTLAIVTAIMLLGVSAAGVFSLAGGALQEQEEKSGDQKKGTQQEPISEEYARTLRQKSEELDKREKELLRREQELAFLEQDLMKKIAAFEAEKDEWEQNRTTYEAEVQRQEQERTSQRVVKIAGGFKNIKASVAAAQLSALYNENRPTALYVISQMDDRTLGKIFSKMTDAALAARILEDFKAWRVEQTPDLISDR